MNLHFVGDRCGDHSPSSGYDQLCSLFPDAGWLSGRELIAGRLTWHKSPASDTLSSSLMFHVLYGDCSGRALPAAIRSRFPGATIVATAHQPVARLVRDPEAVAALRGSDAVIALTQLQARQLAELGLDAPVHVVPHGVWTRAFRPRSTTPGGPRRDRVLLVGNFLRDWEAARRIVDALAAAGVRSSLVGSNVSAEVLAGHPAVERAPRLPERELARAYDRAAALLLPVFDGTASNALLEAMAAGTPVVCTKAPALLEYLGDGVDAFEEGDDQAAVARLLSYATDPARRAARSRDLMERVLQFDWATLERRYARTFGDIAQSRNSSSIPAMVSEEA
jgi:glycosyltransferase involved in cell wall biosynthesis